MIEVQGVNISLVKGELKYEAVNVTDKAKAWARIKKYKNEIRSYLLTFKQADTLADYLDACVFPCGAEERILKNTELLALMESMRVSEDSITGSNLHDKVVADRTVYLNCFNGLKSYQTFDDNKKRKSGSLAKIIHDPKGMSPGTRKQLEALNEAGANISLSINETDGRGRCIENIVKVRAVFADLDGAPLHPVWEYSPSMIVESSPGRYHALWLVGDDFPLEGFKQMQVSIAATFGSDPGIKSLAQPLRMPGFYHQKATQFLSRIIHYSGERYSFGKLTEMFPPAPVDQWSADKYKIRTDFGEASEFKGQYGCSEGGRNHHLTKRGGGMLSRGLSWSEIESEMYKEGQACSPPLCESEIQAVIKSLHRYA